MKILVVSDTHQVTLQLEKILERHADEVQLACHMGDNSQDLLKYQTRYPQLNMVAISGNCDFPSYDAEHVLELKRCAESDEEAVTRILLVHGHNHGVKRNIDGLVYYAKEKGVDACFFGHTHSPVTGMHGGIFIMNPGSPSCPREGSESSYGIVEISPTGEVSGRIIKYEKN